MTFSFYLAVAVLALVGHPVAAICLVLFAAAVE